MSKKKLSSLICLSLVGFVIVSLAIGAWVKSNRASLQTVRLGMPTWKVRIARVFTYDKNGHFGAQTQYLSKQADSQNGNYCVQCRQGKVTAIFVKFTPPLSHDDSVTAMQRLIGHEQVIEKDLSEISNNKTSSENSRNLVKNFCPPSEYFYFPHGKAAELQFVGTDDQRVTDLMVWG